MPLIGGGRRKMYEVMNDAIKPIRERLFNTTWPARCRISCRRHQKIWQQL
jgi:hypothetical protein